MSWWILLPPTSPTFHVTFLTVVFTRFSIIIFCSVLNPNMVQVQCFVKLNCSGPGSVLIKGPRNSLTAHRSKTLEISQSPEGGKSILVVHLLRRKLLGLILTGLLPRSPSPCGQGGLSLSCWVTSCISWFFLSPVICTRFSELLGVRLQISVWGLGHWGSGS